MICTKSYFKIKRLKCTASIPSALLFFLQDFEFEMTNSNSENSPLLQQQKPPLSRPKNRRRRSSFDPSTYNSIGTIADTPSTQDVAKEAGLDLIQILGLTICMAGVQFTCKSKECLSFLNNIYWKRKHIFRDSWVIVSWQRPAQWIKWTNLIICKTLKLWYTISIITWFIQGIDGSRLAGWSLVWFTCTTRKLHFFVVVMRPWLMSVYGYSLLALSAINVPQDSASVDRLL